MNRIAIALLRSGLLLLACIAGPALATNYTFPGALPAGCSSSGGNYTCGALTLGYNDTITIGAPTPTTITINGAFSTNTSQINNSGTAGNLSLVVNGAMTIGYQSRIVANITATSINDSSGQVTFGGSLATSTGSIAVGYASTVAGSITSTSGAITLAGTVQAASSVTCSGCTVTVGNLARITGNVSAKSIVDSNGGVMFGGSVTGTTSNVTIGNASTVAGSVSSTSGAIGLAGTVQVAGSVSCSCALTVGYQARINGNVSATTVTDSNGQVTFGGSVATTTGGMALGYGSTIAGGATSTSGPLSLGGTSRINQCVQSTGSATITLGYGAVATTGVCCGATGSCTSSCVVNNSGGAMPALCGGAGRFNAFDTGTTAGSATGVIHTKIAGSAFNVAVVAVDTASTSVTTTFIGSVKVELLDSSDNTGALTSSTGCRSSWTVAAGTASSTLSFAAIDQGRKNIALTFANAWRDARVRVSYPSTGTATSVGCSSDNFAIRPASFASFRATDATLLTAGTTRTLANSALTGGNVHKAGQPFTVRATAVNGAGSPVTTTNYTGTPIAFASACGGAACTGSLGVMTLPTTTTAGVVSTSTATYTEAGAFSLQLVDADFASVDAADGSTPAEMSIASPTITVGRFVPDHFEIVSLITPVLRTFNSSSCPSRSFTYMGQPFGYATAPQASVLARNLAGATTANYPSAKLSALTITQAYTPLIAATPGVDSSAATLPTVTANNNGTATVAAQASDMLKVVRPATTPLAPFAADIALTWSVTDSSETGTGNGSITTPTPLTMASIAFDMGNEFRFGVLKLNSAYGSELINMAVPLELQYWNGSAFATNAADQCSTLSAGSLALGTYRGNLAACETAPGSASVAFTNGRGILRMLPPGSGNSGSADLTINLGAVAAGQQCSTVGAAATAATTDNLPWLQGKGPAAATYNVNPSARISFGQYRSPLIQLREVY
ncbi:MAG: DUF6701 domain-containing protein [Rhizobacter sp.]